MSAFKKNTWWFLSTYTKMDVGWGERERERRYVRGVCCPYTVYSTLQIKTKYNIIYKGLRYWGHFCKVCLKSKICKRFNKKYVVSLFKILQFAVLSFTHIFSNKTGFPNAVRTKHV